jgi:acetyltransferase
VTLRPIRPEDETQHLSFLLRMDPDDIRMRIFYSRRSIERSELARLTQIDYEREIAFIATWHPDDEHATEETLGVVRALVDPDNVEAEFGILVRSDLKQGGLGRRLMDKLIAVLRQRGTQRLVATVLLENHRMLALAESLGLQPSAEQPDASSRRLEMPLGPAA